MAPLSQPPAWLQEMVPLPGARDVHPVVRGRALAPYWQPEAAARQAAWDEKVLALFRGTEGPIDLMAIGGETYARANFNRVIDGKPLVHHLIDRRDLYALLLLVSGKTEAGWMVSREDTDMAGMPPLEYAVAQNWEEGIKALENYGFMLRDPKLHAPQVHNHYVRVNRIARRVVEAMDSTDVDVLRCALSLGANPDAMIRQDLSFLHMAALGLKIPVVQALIDAGADVNRRHPRGETALQLMWWCHAPKPLSADWRETVAILRAAGADQTGFKLPEEMSDDELLQPMPGAPQNARMIDMLLRAGDYDGYKRGLARLGEGLGAELTTASSVWSQSSLDHLCLVDRLDVAFDPALWGGRVQAMRHAWQAVAAHAAKPSRLRNDQPCSFTAADFAQALAQVRQVALALGAPRHLRLDSRKPGGR